MPLIRDDTFETTYRLVTETGTGGWYWESGEWDNEDDAHAQAHSMFGGLGPNDYAVVEISRRLIPGRSR